MIKNNKIFKKLSYNYDFKNSNLLVDVFINNNNDKIYIFFDNTFIKQNQYENNCFITLEELKAITQFFIDKFKKEEN